MLYKPKFCCNCGEKIERSAPSFTDSKMFCDVCKHDFLPVRAAPLIFCSLMALIGIFGIGSYWRSGEKPLNLSMRQLRTNVSDPDKRASNQPPQVNSNTTVQPKAQTNNGLANAPPVSNLITRPPAKQTDSAPSAVEETVYFCGAPTKKGTPCSRRVRGGGRCWQHKGLNAMLPPEKLRASQ